MYQAGTLSGNPLAMAAGLATLRGLTPEVYEGLEAVSAELETELIEAADGAGAQVRTARVASLLTVFLDSPEAFAAFFHAMLDAGVLLPPSPHEAWFVSAAHGKRELSETLAAARHAFTTTIRGDS